MIPRRAFLATLAAMAAAPRASWADGAAPGLQLGDERPFSAGDVAEMAREMAGRDYTPRPLIP